MKGALRLAVLSARVPGLFGGGGITYALDVPEPSSGASYDATVANGTLDMQVYIPPALADDTNQRTGFYYRVTDVSNCWELYINNYRTFRLDHIASGSRTNHVSVSVIAPLDTWLWIRAVMVGATHTVYTSLDGETWTQRGSPVTLDYNNIQTVVSPIVGNSYNPAPWQIANLRMIAAAAPDPNFAVFRNAAVPLTTPTYDGSGEGMHPSVYYDADKWPDAGGNTYWMGMTPYPASDATYENPSILISDDKTTWAVPLGLTNPIDTPPSGIFSDTDLFVDDDNTMYCFYRQSDGVTYDHLWYKSSSDGVTWGARTSVVDAVGFLAALSPCVLKVGSTYYLYTVDASGAEPYVMTRRSAAAITGPWSAPVACSDVNFPAGRYYWHMDIVYDNGVWFMLANLSRAYLIFATSVNGLAWTFSDTQWSKTQAWEAGDLYRGTLIKIASGFDVWYSARDAVPEWHTGYTTIDYVP